MVIRDATRDDLAGILAIYNEVIAHSTAVYVFQAVDLANRTAWFEGRKAAGYPVLVADDGGAVTGFASFGDFRPSPGYAWTVEHSVHIRADRRGRGLGRAIVQTLIDQARAMGKHAMIGGVDADNVASLALHRRLGFEPVAHFREVGRKFDRWLDLVFLQLLL